MAARIAQHNDLALALLLVAIVALFVLPLPTPLMDLLIASNLAISLVLLIVAMYVPSALSLSTFPSLLLFTTLFRLALNIASTKLILLHADAGAIIDTFGRLIVGNNVVVGCVVFLIIAIVQFIVIAKGSERVAEVAARFALDAMPGKQMSIDAELRAGTLSAAQAQQRRRALEQESQLHGAMDGAMKFVKGDAVAGIVIALVNILAGIAVGSLMHGMPIGEAVQRFSVLAVGDGMVSQIPSLLVSIAAGVVITRVGAVAGAAGSAPLASQMLAQLGGQPRALLISAIALSSFLLVPGFPRWAFVLWIAIVGGAGWAMRKAQQRGSTPPWITQSALAEHDGDTSADDAITVPVLLRLPASLRATLDWPRFERGMVQARHEAEQALGPVYPPVRLAFVAAQPEGSFEALVQDVVVLRGALAAAPALEAELVRHIDAVARRHVPQLIGLQEVQRLMHWMQGHAPDLTAELMRSVPAPRVADMLRRLLQEGVPVRNLRAIFESLVRWAPREEDDVALAEQLRVDLGRFLTSQHVGPERRLDVVLFESPLLDRLLAAVERSPRGNLLLLDPQVREHVVSQVHDLLAGAPPRTAVVVSTNLRRYVRTLLDPVLPQVPVLAFQEIDEDVVLQPCGWVAAPRDDEAAMLADDAPQAATLAPSAGRAGA